MSRDIWFTSDTHFGHEKIIPWCRPQFANVEEMNAHMVALWNETVKTDDLVYHLGDFAWTPKAAMLARPKLKGTVRLIVGNHDNIDALARARLFQKLALWHIFPEVGIVATHVPMRFEQLRNASWNVHGHVHGKNRGLDFFHFDVSVERTGYRPVHIDAIAAWTKLPLLERSAARTLLSPPSEAEGGRDREGTDTGGGLGGDAAAVDGGELRGGRDG
jgi:calcineurin-like phosphoesterase family protein